MSKNEGLKSLCGVLGGPTNYLVYPNSGWSWVRLRLWLGCDNDNGDNIAEIRDDEITIDNGSGHEESVWWCDVVIVIVYSSTVK